MIKKPHFAALLLVPFAPVDAASVFYRDAVLSHNPVAYFEFDESSGTAALDSSGNGNHGTIVGTLTPGAASGAPNLGTAFDFGGGYVTIPALGTFARSTFETWIQLDQVNGGCCTGILTSSGWAPGRVHINVTFGLFEHAVNSDVAEVVRSTPGPVAGEWYHLVITNDVAADETNFYLNGSLVGDNGDHSLSDVFYGPEMQIGAWDGTRQLDGRLDEVAVYDSILSADDVAANFAAASIPEPSGTMLFLLGGIMICSRRGVRN